MSNIDDEVDLDLLQGLMESEVPPQEDQEETPQQQARALTIEELMAGDEAEEEEEGTGTVRSQGKRARDETTNDEGDDDDEEERRRQRKAEKKEKKRLQKEAEKRSKQRKQRVSSYIDDQAGGSSGEEEMDGDDDGEEAEAVVEEDYIKNHKSHRYLFHEGDEAKTNEELAREIEERNNLQKARDRGSRLRVVRKSGGGAAAEEVVDDGVIEDMVPRRIPSAARYASLFLPKPSDPKVFAVKCKPGMARILVARIVNKCYHYRIGQNDENKKIDLGIISVFALDHVKQYIYVESHRKLFVENTLNGLVGVFRFQISVVEPSELMQLLEPRRPGGVSGDGVLQEGQLVRLRQNPYRGDLAMVTAIDAETRRVTVKCVPREDFVGRTYHKVTVRLPPKFFIPHAALGAHAGVEGMTRWGDLIFDPEGYLLKSVSNRNLIYGTFMEKPTVHELAQFCNDNKQQMETLLRSLMATSASQLVHELRVGDVVRVHSGQLRNTVGTIVDIAIANNTAKLSCRLPSRPQPIEVKTEISNLVKFFSHGVHIVVEQGPRKGESGTVVHVQGSSLRILSDQAAEELEVHAADCRQSNLVGTVGHQIGTWRLFDLVMLVDGVTVGCHAKMTPTYFTIITVQNQAMKVEASQIRSSLRGRRLAPDRLQNKITVGSEVLLPAAMNTSSIGGIALDFAAAKVEQIYDQTVFVRRGHLVENSGIVAVPASQVQLVGGRTTTIQALPAKQLPVPERKAHPATRVLGYVPDVTVPSERHSLAHEALSAEYPPE